MSLQLTSNNSEHFVPFNLKDPIATVIVKYLQFPQLEYPDTQIPPRMFLISIQCRKNAFDKIYRKISPFTKYSKLCCQPLFFFLFVCYQLYTTGYLHAVDHFQFHPLLHMGRNSVQLVIIS